MMRPSVDVVVPFRGTAAEREELCARLARLKLRPGDSVMIVDNTPGQERSDPQAAHERIEGGELDTVRVLVGPGRRVPASARNRGSRQGAAPWILFLDDDICPPDDLLDRYFDPEPEAGTGVLAGGVRDEFVPKSGPASARYAYIRAATSQDDTLAGGDWGFPKTANVAIRRAAFEAVGRFRDDIRAAEDSDLTYRLRAAGWGVERREQASVTHRNRQTMRSYIVQKATHGSGGAWLDQQYPGASPPRRRVGLLWWGLRISFRGLLAAVRFRDRDRAIRALCQPVEALAFEFGRSLPNERPLTLGAWWRALRRLRRGPAPPER